MIANEANLQYQRLESDLIYSIRKFHQYAELHPVERNKAVVNILEELLREALKHQLKESVYDNQ